MEKYNRRGTRQILWRKILSVIFAYCMSFSSFKCKFVPRQCNRVADVLVNSAKDFQLETWLNLPPRFLVHVLLADAAFV